MAPHPIITDYLKGGNSASAVLGHIHSIYFMF